MRRWSHHLNPWVQDYFDSGAPGNFICSHHVMTPQQRNLLRKQLRETRRQLTSRQQDEASVRLHHNISGQRFFRSARRIAFYLSSDNEIDPHLLLADALSRGQHCYLPVLHPRGENRLLFVRYRQGDQLKCNRWGIPEPRLDGSMLNPRTLDVVFVPLVGFDAEGNRLGMGKGFYDRTFAFRSLTKRRRPLLIGLAHECQRMESLDNQSWDIGMDRIVTDQRIWRSALIL